jgi:hypothetical protein
MNFALEYQDITQIKVYFVIEGPSTDFTQFNLETMHDIVALCVLHVLTHEPLVALDEDEAGHNS